MQEKYTKFVDGYKLTNCLLGKGSFSEVLLAYARDSRKLAVKLIHRKQISQSDYATFRSELEVLQTIQHENIVELVDFKKSQNNFYLFLEYCQGGSLCQYIQERKKLSQPQAIKIFSQIVRGVSALHKYKIMHRDLKPANILLKNGKVKIADFGLACKFSKNEMLKTFAGTPIHMAPQILKRKLYNEKVDIYSAGTILYQMLYGSMPYKGNDTKTLIEAIQMGALSFDSQNVSQRIRKLLTGMLRPEPEERIDLQQLMGCMNSYELQRKQELLINYRRLSQASAAHLGAAGGLFCKFQLQSNAPKRASDMDMRIYNKLCKKLSAEAIPA